ncbi:MAG: site-specific DNA-methyltransferase [Anaerolineales bacterium]|nr:site-specific DNA-methyltransferase [Anaerolineales bacterium]
MTEIIYPPQENLYECLTKAPANSTNAIILISGALDWRDTIGIKNYLNHCIRVLKPGGLLFFQGMPYYLPEFGIFLDKFLVFKYWIAIKSILHNPTKGIPSEHAAILLYVKGKERFNIQRVRFPHEVCSFCKKPLKDWGGKTHLMNPEGYAISDVWKSLPVGDNYSQLTSDVISTLIKMIGVQPDYPKEQSKNIFSNKIQDDFNQSKIIIGPREGIEVLEHFICEPHHQYYLPGFSATVNKEIKTTKINSNYWDVIHQGDAIDILKQYPDNSIDLVFADPPYNLEKAYGVYNDGKGIDTYLDWCSSWLIEYIRILKPTGSLWLLNLPHWAMYHAHFLNQYLYFQNWVVWDALSEPRGKLMPAHYALLFYTKHPTKFTLNYELLKNIDSRQYCLRSSCINKRKSSGDDQKDLLTDIWSDIHRLKHKRDRDYHPCQLPDALMERIILLSTNPGDIVLDALVGTGTTVVQAARLGRKYVGIDIDAEYVQISSDKLEQINKNGFVLRKTIHRQKSSINKKALQLELKELARNLGRLPTPNDVKENSKYGLDAYLEAFPTWGKALKAAKLEVRENANRRSENIFQ